MTRRSRRVAVRTARRVAWLMCLLAIYLSLFGVGSETRSFTVLGSGLFLVAMAVWIAAVVLGRAPMWVRGTAQVRGVSEVPTSEYGLCELDLVVDAPGMPRVLVKVQEPRLPIAKWPVPGGILPIKVSASDVHRLQVLWGEVTASYPSSSWSSG